MTAIRLDFPVFVSVRDVAGTRRRVVLPLLGPAILGEGQTLERALQSCAGQLRKHLQHERIGRENVEEILALAFRPELRVDTPALDLRIDSKTLRHERVMLASFKAGGQRWGCLPRFGRHVFLAGSDLRWPEMLERTQDEVQALLQRWRKEEGAPPGVDLERLGIQKGDLITDLGCTVELRPGRFGFEGVDFSGLFAMAGQDREFDGAIEIHRVAEDLNLRFPEQLSRADEPDERVERVAEALYGPHPRAVVLLGPSGAGRSTLLHEALFQHLDRFGDSPDRTTKLWHLDPTRVVAGMSIIGHWQRRAEAVFGHIRHRREKRYGAGFAGKPDALFIDNPVALCRVGRSAGSRLTLSTVLRPHVEARHFPVLIEATPEQWRRVEEMDRSFADLFSVLRVPAASRERAVRILVHRRASIEAESGCSITRAALSRILAIEDRFPSVRVPPGSYVRRLETLSAREPGGRIDARDVDAAFREHSGLREEILDTGKPLSDEVLRSKLEGQLIGQPEAITALAEVVHAVRTGLARPGKPVATLLFVGPTGVGKTEAAKLLAATLFSSPEALLRFDMNEYVDAGAAARLVGDAHRPEGLLVGAVRHRPFCVLLLDEIEKAHPSVHDLLLQVLDEGRLSDLGGRVADFGRATIILTSNAGAREASRGLGFDQGAAVMAGRYRTALERLFRPEFLNRIDRTVVFQSLAAEHIQAVARLQLARLLRREGLARRVVLLDVDEGALDHLARRGFDPQMGARSLKRVLEAELVGPIARRLAGLPVEEPVLLSIQRQEGQLLTSVTLLPWAMRGPERSEVEPDAGILDQELRALEDRIPAKARMASDEMLLLSSIRDQYQVLEPYLEVDDDLPETGLQSFAHRLRTGPIAANHWSYRYQFNPREMASFDRVQDYIESLFAEAPRERGPDPVLEQVRLRLLSLRLQVEGLGGGQSPGCALVLRRFPDGVGDWMDARMLLIDLERLIGDLHGRTTLYRVGLMGPQPSDLSDLKPGARVLVARAPGLLDLLREERGVTLLQHEDGRSEALHLSVLPLESEDPLELLERAGRIGDGPDRNRAVLRLVTLGPNGKVLDLRTGEGCDFDELPARLEGWIHAARGGRA